MDNATLAFIAGLITGILAAVFMPMLYVWRWRK
jgi:type II secretory pathway component PulF